MSEKDYYIRLSNRVSRSVELNVYEKALFCVLLSYKGMDQIYISHKILAEQSNMKRTKLIMTLKTLEEKKYIKVAKSGRYNTNIYQILKRGVVRDTDIYVRHTDTDVHNTDRGCTPHGQGDVRDTDTSNKVLSNNKLVKENKEKDAIKSLAEFFISYLNEKTLREGKSLLHVTDTVKRDIMSRCKDLKKHPHYKEDFKSAFKHVIDVTCEAWLDNEDMYNHLNATTLLRASNFGKYLTWQYRSKGPLNKVAKNANDAFKDWLPKFMEIDGEWYNRDEQMKIYEKLDDLGKNNFRDKAKKQKQSRHNINDVISGIGG